jgi:AcrR family transcriptional regulator
MHRALQRRVSPEVGRWQSVARQARSEVTRRKILAAAVELFDELGYSVVGLAEVSERANVTKSGLYYHFDSKESVAEAIVEEGTARLITAFGEVLASPAPAIENLMFGSFVVAELIADDAAVRTGSQLSRILGNYTDKLSSQFRDWLAGMTMMARQAQVEGDLRADLDPEEAGEVIYTALAGAEMISNAASGGRDLLRRTVSVWEILLPAVVTDESLPYLRQALSRAAARLTVNASEDSKKLEGV